MFDSAVADEVFFFFQNKFLALHQSCEGEAQFHMMLTASDD